MAGFASSDDEMISGINVTPLVDVVLVLLVIFLITAPVIYQSAIKVQLPKAKSGETNPKSPIQFTIAKNGDLSWGSDHVTWEEIGKRLSAMKETASSQTAMISADESTPHGIVIKLMDLLRMAGLTQFALNVETQPTSSK